MEAKQFAELLKSPLLVEQLPVDALRDLVSRYPFSPSLQMLLLKHYQLSEHSAYDEQLAKTAISIPDRRALYRLVQLRPITTEVRSPNERPEIEIAIEEEPDAPVEETVEAPEINTWHLPIEPGVAPYQEHDEEGALDQPEIERAVSEEPLTASEPTKWHLPIEPGIVPDEVETAEAPEEIDITNTEMGEESEEVQIEPLVDTSEDEEKELPKITNTEVAKPETPEVAEHETEVVLVEETAIEEAEPETVVATSFEEDIQPAETETAQEVVEEPATKEEVQATEEPAIVEEIQAGEEEEPIAPSTYTETEEVASVMPEVKPEAVEEELEILPEAKDNQTREAKLETSKASFNVWLQRLKHHDIPVAPVAEASVNYTTQPATNVTQSPSTITQDRLGEGRNSQPVTDAPEVNELDALFGAGTYEASLIKDSIDMPNKPFTDPTVKTSKEELMEPDETANKRMDEQAKKSLSMGEELVTETLAKIYEIQKKHVKAIEAYEILKQRHPHKADEYDRKIQKLREI